MKCFVPILAVPFLALSETGEREKLALYRGLAEEGKRLDHFCRESRPTIHYGDTWTLDQALRSTMATVQLLGLETTIEALAKYAEYFQFSPTEYGHLVDNLVGNFCSKNITVMGLGEIREAMMARGKKKDFFLPPPDAITASPEREYRKREFGLTLDLFKIFCSWGGDIRERVLLPVLLRNPIWMGFVGRHIAGEKVIWNEGNNTLSVASDRESTRVLCDNLICRKRLPDDFERSFHYAIGSNGIRDDFNRLYCQHLRSIDFNRRHRDPRIKKMVDTWSFDDHNLLNAQMIALVTGVPDFFVRSKTFHEAREFMRASIDENWKNWALARIQEFDGRFPYEEFLTISPVSRDGPYGAKRGHFPVEFNINMGEFDGIHQRTGKLTVGSALTVSGLSLRYLATSLKGIGPNRVEERERAQEHFASLIRDKVQKIREVSNIPLPERGLENLIAVQLARELENFPGPLPGKKDTVSIPLKFHFSLFALDYMRERYAALGGHSPSE